MRKRYKKPKDKNRVKKREITAWAMYDFANSSYTTVIISAVYSAFFSSVIVPKNSDLHDSYWSIAMVGSAIIAIIMSPLVGAICDYAGRKKRYLFYATLLCTLCTALLSLVSQGDVWSAILLVMLSNAGFMLGESFCASFLTDLSTKETIGLISGLGWGLGYFGGLASLMLVQVIIVAPQTDLLMYIKQNQIAAGAIAAFYFIASLPTFLIVKERSKPKPGFEDASIGRLFKKGVNEMLNSAHLVKQNSTLFKFFAAFTVYMAGLEIILKFIGIYAREELAMQMSDLIWLFLILQITAAVGAILFGFLESYLGPKRTVQATILWWIAGILGIYFLQPIADLLSIKPLTLFFIIAAIAGSGIGSIQSSSRTVVGLLTPKGRSAQMFGFWGMFSRVSIILGMLFGPLADLLHSRRQAILLVIAFFIVGGLMLKMVNFEKGLRQAEESD